MKKFSIISISLLLAVILAIFLMAYPDSGKALMSFLTEDVHPAFFIILMLILPICGMSIGVFLILVGMKFSVSYGLMLTAVLMLLHMLTAYFLVHSFLRWRIVDFLASRGRSIPSLRHKGGLKIAFLFALVPGLPYAVKNYLLALTDISISEYLLTNWSAQFIMSIPFVILGEAFLTQKKGGLSIILLVLALGYMLLYFIRRQGDETQSIDNNKTDIS